MAGPCQFYEGAEQVAIRPCPDYDATGGTVHDPCRTCDGDAEVALRISRSGDRYELVGPASRFINDDEIETDYRDEPSSASPWWADEVGDWL